MKNKKTDKQKVLDEIEKKTKDQTDNKEKEKLMEEIARRVSTEIVGLQITELKDLIARGEIKIKKFKHGKKEKVIIEKKGEETKVEPEKEKKKSKLSDWL